MALPDALSILYPSFTALPVVLLFTCILYFVVPRFRPLLILILAIYASFLLFPLLHTYALRPLWSTVLRPIWRAVNWMLFPLKFAARMLYRGALWLVYAVQQIGIWVAWFGFYVYFGKMGWEYIQDAWDWVYDAGRRVGYFLEELSKEEKAAKAKEDGSTGSETVVGDEDDEEEEEEGVENGEEGAPRTSRHRRRSSTKKRKGKGK
ncbi:hypothetical protein FB107DRAFT_270966 [Schizophyllum commune]